MRSFKGIEYVFQSTPPRGGRREYWSHPIARSRRSSFNPRPRAGGDASARVAGEALVFQSTPPRGGRQHVLRNVRQRRRVSIHAPARGATGSPCEGTRLLPWLFQSTPRAGGDTPWPPECGSMKGFNPRPRAGGDRSSRLST